MVLDLPAGTQQDSWYIGNIRHTGWYRVNYDRDNWRLLSNQLQADFSQIHQIHRAQLLDDSFNLGRAEVINQTMFLDITKYLSKETDPLAFTPAFIGFNYMLTFIQDYPQVNDLFQVNRS